ncbi:MAG: hypothetical protein M1820_010051 [Bogoriella megaspora]|nr:MAG: hypothetical protein M1820_010051 [Bogoriella megaspora]
MAQYTFGVELEMLIRPNELTESKLKPIGFFSNITRELNGDYDANREIVHKYLAFFLSHCRLPTIVRGAKVFEKQHENGNKDYSVWAVEHDPSVQESQGYYSTELVSPIFKLGLQSHKWKDEIEKIWEIIKDSHSVGKHFSASTHVHIRPAALKFSIGEVKQLCKGFLIFDRIIRETLPPESAAQGWCCNNAHKRDGDVERPEVGELIHPELARHYDRDPTWPQCHRLVRWIDDRHVAWNLQPLLQSDKRQTIEFRMGPPALSSTDTRHWIAFTACFVHFCLEFDFENVARSLGLARYRQQSVLQCVKKIFVYRKFKNKLSASAAALGLSDELRMPEYLSEHVTLTGYDTDLDS